MRRVSEAYRTYADGRLAGLRTTRNSWLVHWRELAEYILPRRYRWLVTANNAARGSQINGTIVDSHRHAGGPHPVSGMMNGITQPDPALVQAAHRGLRRGLRGPILAVGLRAPDDDGVSGQQFLPSDGDHVFRPGRLWLGLRHHLRELSRTSFTASTHALASSYFDLNNNLEVGTVAREFTLTYCQMVEEFGEEKVSAARYARDIRTAPPKSREKMIGHIIEPNRGDFGLVPKQFPFREVYWESAAPTTRCFANRASTTGR